MIAASARLACKKQYQPRGNGNPATPLRTSPLICDLRIVTGQHSCCGVVMKKGAGKPNGNAHPSNSHGTPEVLPRPDFHFKGEVGRTYLDSDPARFPQPVRAPASAPNILLILIDDCG